jgi:leucyl-tRNA synthetase
MGSCAAGSWCREEQVVGRALADPAVRRFLDGKPIRKVVYVPDRLVNLVV